MTKKFTPKISQLLDSLSLSSDTTPELREWQRFLAEVGRLGPNGNGSNGNAHSKSDREFSNIQTLLESPLIQNKIEARVEEQTKGLKESLESGQTYMDALPDMILHVDSQGYIVGFKGFKFLHDQPESLLLLGKHLSALWSEDAVSSLEGAISEALSSQRLVTLHVSPPKEFPIDANANVEIRVSPADAETGLIIARLVAPLQSLNPTDTVPNLKVVSQSQVDSQPSISLKSYEESRLSSQELLNLGQLLSLNNT
ncbi:MAG: hypothetical protein AAF485_30880 [Chloroflexota bacterium]